MSRYTHPNHFKYLKAPTIEMIEKVLAAHDVEENQFERFYGIYRTCIKHVRRGVRPFPVQHWHVIYECLRMIEDGKPLPIYKEDIPQAAEEKSFLASIFKTSKKKRTTKRQSVKRTGTLCELC